MQLKFIFSLDFMDSCLLYWIVLYGLQHFHFCWLICFLLSWTYLAVWCCMFVILFCHDVIYLHFVSCLVKRSWTIFVVYKIAWWWERICERCRICTAVGRWIWWIGQRVSQRISTEAYRRAAESLWSRVCRSTNCTIIVLNLVTYNTTCLRGLVV